MDSLATIWCDPCGWLRRTPLLADALAFSTYRSRLGKCAGHRMTVELVDADAIDTGMRRTGPDGGWLHRTIEQAFGRQLWPLEVTAARLFEEAFNLGANSKGLESMLQLVLGRHMLLDARDRLIKIAWNLGRTSAKRQPERNWRRKYHVGSCHV